MSRFKLFAFAAALTVLPLSVQAEDPPKEKRKEVKIKTEEKKSRVERGHNAFTNFWVNTVGGNIGGGLKSGARKIGNAFD